MLYSYLLTEKLFSLESQPTPPTKKKRFAYKLYLDTILLLTDVASAVEMRGHGRPLLDNRFIKTILADEKIKSLRARGRSDADGELPPALIARLAAAVKDSAIFKNYVKSAGLDSVDDIRVWHDIYNHIIAPDAELNRIVALRPDYSMRGVERAKELMTDTFANFSSSQDHISDALKSLRISLDKAHELYYRLLLLPIELTALQGQKLDAARHKYIVTSDDLNPNMRFVENECVARLASLEKLQSFADAQKISWLPNDHLLMNSLLKAITSSDIYKEYMAAPSTDFSTDCALWKNLFKHVILENEDLREALEDKSVFWNDDLDIIGTFVIKTLRRVEEGDAMPLMPMYKDEEDARFASELFTAVVKNKEEYRAMINDVVNSDSWDMDRLAFMDVVITMTAIAELLNFPKIPVTVTINEYIEMAKSYSTTKSGYFINGLLASIVRRLKADGALHKD